MQVHIEQQFDTQSMIYGLQRSINGHLSADIAIPSIGQYPPYLKRRCAISYISLLKTPWLGVELAAYLRRRGSLEMDTRDDHI